MQKKGFTLVEILIVIFVISMGLILIIRGMSETHRYLSETAQKTIALNLAKEGIEAVYNLRNSNWRKWSDKKNECWLNVNKEECDEYSRKLTDNQMRIFGMSDGDTCVYQYNLWYGPIKIGTTNGFLPEGSDISQRIRDDKEARFKNFEENRSPKNNQQYKLVYYRGKRIPLWNISGHERGFYHGEWIGNQNCPDEYMEKNTSPWEYSRVITIHGLYDKETKKQLSCTYDHHDKECNSSSPKELRFCSTVFYTKPYQWVVNICSIMTNFEQ